MNHLVPILFILLAGCTQNGSFQTALYQANFQDGTLNADKFPDLDPVYLYVKLFDIDYVEENSQAIPLEKLKKLAIDSSAYKLVAGIRVGAETFIHKEKEEEDYFEYLAHRAFGQMAKIWKNVGLGEIKRLYIQCDWTPQTEPDVTMFFDTFTQFCSELGIEVSIFMPKYYKNSLQEAYSIHPDRWVIAYGAGENQIMNGRQVNGSFPDINFCNKVLADGAAVDILFIGKDSDLKQAYQLPLPDARMIFYDSNSAESQ